MYWHFYKAYIKAVKHTKFNKTETFVKFVKTF